MSEYDAFNGLSESKEEARRELIKKANEEFLKQQELRKTLQRKRFIRNLLKAFLLIIIIISYILLKRYF